MPRPRLDRLHLGPEANRLQDRLEDAITPFVTNPISQGRLVEVDLTGSFQDIAHRLGRRWQGYIVVAADTSISLPVWEESSDESKYLRLKSSAAAVAKLWVF